MRRKLDSGVYYDCEDFEEDFRVMLTNCFTFNHPGDEVYEIGKKFEALFENLWSNKPVPGASPPVYKSSKSHSNKNHASAPMASGGADDDSSDDEYNNQQIALLQQNLTLMSSQLAMLMEKKRRKKEKRKSLGFGDAKSKSAQKKRLNPDLDSLPEMSFEQKKELSEKINSLPAEKVVDVFQIIREGMPSIDDVCAI